MPRKKKLPPHYRVWGSGPLEGETTYYRGTNRRVAEAAFDERSDRNFEGMGDDDESVVIERDGRELRRFSPASHQPTYFGGPRSKMERHHATKISGRKQYDFVEYLLSFYGKEGIYGPSNSNPIFRPAMSKKEAILAADIVGAAKDFEGDSFDREKARDLVLSWRDSTPKKHASTHATKTSGEGASPRKTHRITSRSDKEYRCSCGPSFRREADAERHAEWARDRGDAVTWEYI